MTDLIANELLADDAEDLGKADEIDVIAGLVSLAGCRLVDIGCGGGRVTRGLVARGAVAVGVEPDPIQAAKNREAEPVPNLAFAEAPGEALPLADDAMDVALFSYSLHHVPETKMAAALAEAIRVLKPVTGTLLVMEPMLSGTMEALYRPFHDKSPVRRAAYGAMRRNAKPRFAEHREVYWCEDSRYDDFESFVAENVSTTHTAFSRERIDTPEVRARFDAGRKDDGFVFSQFIRLDLFRGRLD